MGEKRDFFQALRERLQASADADFDRRFWGAFKREVSGVGRLSWWTRWRFTVPVVSAAVALLIILLLKEPKHPSESELAEAGVVSEMMEDSELFRDLDIFASFEELPESDEDWEVLLGNKIGEG